MKKLPKNKNLVKIFATTAILVSIAIAATYIAKNNSSDQVIAKIGNKKIFKSQIQSKLAEVFSGGAQNADVKVPDLESLPIEIIEVLAKEVYINEMLINEAKKSKASYNDQTKAKIKSAKNIILVESYISSIVDSKVNEEAVKNKYLELVKDLEGKKEYQIKHIVVAKESEATKLYKKLERNPGSFDKFVVQYSIDKESANNKGSLGYIIEDNIIKEIADEIFKMEKNQISKPIQTQYGWHIIKYTDIRDAKVLEFESVANNIRSQMVQETIANIKSDLIKDKEVKILFSKPEEAEDLDQDKNEEESEE